MIPSLILRPVPASALIALACWTARQEAAPRPVDDYRPALVELQGEVAHIPFVGGSRRPIPVVEASVNGGGSYKFFYDTGASACVLDAGFVKELGIPVLGETEIGDHTASARIPAQRVRMDSLELDGVYFESVPAVAFDRSRLEGATIRGVLGLPLFREQLLTVDYVNERLEISTARLPEKGAGVLPYTGEFMPEIQITVCGKPLSCHIDSGSPGGFMLPAALVESLAHKSEPSLKGKARTVNSEFEIWSVQLDGTITVAGIDFEDPQVDYSSILPNGNIGYLVLRDHLLSIDQRSKRVRLLPAKRAKTGEAPEPSSGEPDSDGSSS